MKGQTYIVARTPTNVADSVLVTTRGAVALVVANPTRSRFSAGHGDGDGGAARSRRQRDLDRAATFSSSDDKIASVSASGS